MSNHTILAVRIHCEPDVIKRYRVNHRDGETLDERYDRIDRAVERISANSLELFGESCVDVECEEAR